MSSSSLTEMNFSACAASLCRCISSKYIDPKDITCKIARNTQSQNPYFHKNWIANGRHLKGNEVSPGIWSAAEAQTLVLSCNLPLTSPVFRRCGDFLGLCLHKARNSREEEEEESSNILELSGPKSRSIDNKNKATVIKIKMMMGKSAFLETNARRFAENDRRMGAREELPNGQIMIELNLEQNVHRLGTNLSMVSRSSAGTPFQGKRRHIAVIRTISSVLCIFVIKKKNLWYSIYLRKLCI